MDDEGTKEAVLIYGRIMGMIPIRAVLLEGKVVCEGGIWLDWTLSDGRAAIHEIGTYISKEENERPFWYCPCQ